jgi:hypothetical protein
VPHVARLPFLKASDDSPAHVVAGIYLKRISDDSRVLDALLRELNAEKHDYVSA